MLPTKRAFLDHEKRYIFLLARKSILQFQGIRENLELIKKHYPGWVMRLYYDLQSEESPVLDELCQISCSEPMFDACDASRNARLGNASILYPLVWRFLPAIDVQVKRI